ncbi:amidase [Sinobaca sp. H24]|uniref:amidase n=1 Tax=Sinobaca sp. H24 TaxID=2923376 RepID=UPI00207A17D3|nr:amidase [Sinobaca sp. H24]
MEDTLLYRSASQLALMIQQQELSSRELMEASLARIRSINPHINAIVSLDEERALKGADEADRALASGAVTGPFHGLPIAVKDTHHAEGFPTTFGSLAFKDHISTSDDLITERLKQAGAIVIGKTNVPEFAAGSHTFNQVFSTTRNPYDLTKTAGGSSGGAAAAVASGLIPFADGSDMGGSLRFPAAFNNVVGLRPSPGRLPMYPKAAPFSPLAVQGPITRSTEDAFFMLSTLAGPDPRAPISIEEPGSVFTKPLHNDISGMKIAWSADFGGQLPIEPEIQRVFKEQLSIFEKDLGCELEEACPSFQEAEEAFQILRAWEFELTYKDIANKHGELLKDSFMTNFQKGQRLSGPDIGRAEQLHHNLYHRLRLFFETYDALLLPVSQVVPFSADIEYPSSINGLPMHSYLDWMKSCYYISAAGNPALSIPGGFTADHLPTGLQIVGPHHADYEVLRIGQAFEKAAAYGEKRPVFPAVTNE